MFKLQSPLLWMVLKLLLLITSFLYHPSLFLSFSVNTSAYLDCLLYRVTQTFITEGFTLLITGHCQAVVAEIDNSVYQQPESNKKCLSESSEFPYLLLLPQ